MKRIIAIVLFLFCAAAFLTAEIKPFVRAQAGKGDFSLVKGGQAATIYYEKADAKVVEIAANDLAKDIELATGVKPQVTTGRSGLKGNVVIIGSLAKSGLVKQLARGRKINVSGVTGKWEAFVLQTVNRPLAGVTQALVIAGSDRRGTAYGVYELSSQIGVSPWYWWADAPVKKKDEVFVKQGRYTMGKPKVKYRGIFINDEAPALTGWVYEKFGGFNARFYKEVFELILRLKGNFIWPAMWIPQAFFANDPDNAQLADDYAIVIGTSHHEPMMRAHAEWRGFGKGSPWNYERNEARLKEFWRTGVERASYLERLVTVGMRGDGDKPMSDSGDNLPLLEKIVADQRVILADVLKKKPEQVPQVWALYKEVQDYYDKGMRVPDDVTLLLCDDNYGNIRRLPLLASKPRKGGYGIYYHFDYVGGPRNYKWLNTNYLPKIWEQMHLAYEYKVRQIWIVNVGDIKPMEFPISFFLDYAWDPDVWPAERLPEYTRLWAEQQFGDDYAEEVAYLLSTYTRYNSRRKPEHTYPYTYSKTNYKEAKGALAEYKALAARAEKLAVSIRPEYKDAYFQLVHYPIKACANFLELYVLLGDQWLGRLQKRAAANWVADRCQTYLTRDAAYAEEYHKLGGGKWNRMMSQTNIGYIGWQEPPKDQLPTLRNVKASDKAEMGVAIEGSQDWWPEEKTTAVLPEFNSFTRLDSYFDVYCRGTKEFEYTVKEDVPWLTVSSTGGIIYGEVRIVVSVDWENAPLGTEKVPIVVKGAGTTVIVQAVLKNYSQDEAAQAVGYIETDGYVSIEAEHYSRAVNAGQLKWMIIPEYGRTLSGMMTTPVTAPGTIPGGDCPVLVYPVYLYTTGQVEVSTYLSPTLNFHNTEGIRYAVSFDDQEPVVVNATKGVNWDSLAMDNAMVKKSKHTVSQPGYHVLKIWRVDPQLVFQKVVVDSGNLRRSYLGPPESPFQPASKK